MAKAGKTRNLKDYAGVSHKLDGGPGGISCPCCTNFNRRKAKQRQHQVYRRVTKRALTNQIEDVA